MCMQALRSIVLDIFRVAGTIWHVCRKCCMWWVSPIYVQGEKSNQSFVFPQDEDMGQMMFSEESPHGIELGCKDAPDKKEEWLRMGLHFSILRSRMLAAIEWPTQLKVVPSLEVVVVPLKQTIWRYIFLVKCNCSLILFGVPQCF